MTRSYLHMGNWIRLAVLLTAAGGALSAGAQTTKYWDVDTIDQLGAGGATPSGTWDTGTTANWNINADGSGVPTTWSAGDSAVFAAGSDATGAYTVTVSGTQSLVGLTVEEGTVSQTGGSLDFGATAGAPISIASGASWIQDAASVLAGTEGLVKSGAGTLTLRGTNTFSNAGTGTQPYLTINDGVVDFTADSQLGAVPGANTVGGILTINGGTLRYNNSTSTTLNVNRNIDIGANGATIEVTQSNNLGLSLPGSANSTLAIRGSSTITKTGPGRFTLNTTQSGYTGKWVIKGGTLRIAQDAAPNGRLGPVPGSPLADYITLDGGGLGSGTTSAITLQANRGITLGAAGGFLSQPGAGPFTYNGIIAGTLGGNITFQSSDTVATFTGGVFVIGGANTYNGNTLIGASTTLKLGASGVIPDTSVVSPQASAGIFDLNGFDETVKSVAGTAGTIAVGVKTLTLDNPAGESNASLFTASAGGKVIKNGSGALSLTGGSTGFNGEFIMNSGTLGVGASNAFGNGADGTDASTFTYNGGVLSNTGTGGRTIPAGVSVNLNVDVTADDSLFNTSAPGQMLFNGTATTNASRIITVNGLANLGFANIAESSAGSTLTKNGTGILVLSGNNSSYTGDTTVTNGTLRYTSGTAGTYAGSIFVPAGGRLEVDADGVVGSGNNPINLQGGALGISASRTVSFFSPVNITANSAITTSSAASTPQFDFGDSTTGNPFNISGGVTLITMRNDGADAASDQFRVRLFGGNFTISTPIDLAAGNLGSTTELSSFNIAGTTQTFSGVISGTGDFKRSASASGNAGKTVFMAQNTFSGGVQLNDGTIEFGVDSVGSPGSLTSGPVGTGAITTNNNLTVAVAANGGARNVGNAIVFGAGNNLGITGANDLTLSGDVNLGAAARTVSVDNSGLSVLSGTISGAGGSLTKDLAGVLKVTGNNTYDAGTTVTAGTLLVSNTTGSGTGTGTVTVASAGTLGGTGTVGGTITNNGTIAPGESVGTLNVTGNVIDGTGSNWAIELSGASADKLAVTGDIDLTAVDNLIVSGSGTGSSWLIGTYTGILSGTFDTITSGYTVSYTGGNIMLNAAVAGLPGDFNSDGKVDSGDYVTWRKNEVANLPLANDGGATNQADRFTLWRANYGNPPGAGSGRGVGGSAVPEPSTAVLLAMGLLATRCRRRG